jgi:predicted nucleotidyltransferase
VKGRLFRAVGNLPEDVSASQLDEAGKLIRSQASHLGEDVIVQGSRAGHSARPASDIDFGLRVDPDRFDDLVRQRFGTPNPGSSKERTMLEALARGRIHTGEAGLRQLRNSLEDALGKKVDISVIKRGGLFDGEPWLPVP